MRVSADPIEVGVAQASITPPRYSVLIGYGDRFLGSSGVRDELLASVLVLRNGTTSVVLVTLDLLALHEDWVAQIQAEVAKRVPCGSKNVFVACSHTHAGPIAWAGAWSGMRRRRLLRRLVRTVAETATRAWEQLTPAQGFIGTGSCDIAVNRREIGADGHVEIGVNRDGPVDRSLGVLQWRALDGTPRATLVNFACHPTVLSPRNRRVSADWPGAMRRRIETETGAPCLFLQGAAADLNPDHEWGSQDSEAVDQLGTRVAEAVSSRIALGLQPLAPLPLAVWQDEVALPVRMRTRVENGRPGIESYRETGARLLGVPRFLIDPLLSLLYPWRSRLRASGNGSAEMPLALHGVRIGDLILIGLGAETFNEIGTRIKENSPSPHTWFAGYSNGMIGYLTTTQAHGEGGYEVEQAPLAYRMSGTYDAGCEALVLERCRAAVSALLS